jgi:hypothetical protein
MLIPVALSLLGASVPATPAVAGSVSPPSARKRQVCVPARDGAGRPTGALVCRTAVQWESFLRDHGYLEVTGRPPPSAGSFVAPDQLYRPRR